MKLIRKINIRFIIAAFSIMLLMGVALSIVLKITFNEEMQESMEFTLHRVKTQLHKNIELYSLPPFFEIATINYTPDTLFYDEIAMKIDGVVHDEIFKQLNTVFTINNKTYKVGIRESALEMDDFLESITTIVLVAIFLMILLLYLINRRIAQTIWSDFYGNLKKVKEFSVQKQLPLSLNNTDITEFNELNDVIFSLTNTVIADYKNLKQFSEDASHELQTPLAIIRSKLETLIEAGELNPTQIEKIETIYNTTNRLTRLNKDLLLLAKLENNQFHREPLLLQDFIKNKVDEWQEIIQLNHMKISMDFKNDIEVNINPNLADILISNLLSNAINHNLSEGDIILTINGNMLVVANSGVERIKNSESIFNRFHKEGLSKQSLGLGLAIVKKICDTHNIVINYSFLDKMHCFTLIFSL